MRSWMALGDCWASGVSLETSFDQPEMMRMSFACPKPKWNPSHILHLTPYHYLVIEFQNFHSFFILSPDPCHFPLQTSFSLQPGPASISQARQDYLTSEVSSLTTEVEALKKDAATFTDRLSQLEEVPNKTPTWAVANCECLVRLVGGL